MKIKVFKTWLSSGSVLRVAKFQSHRWSHWLFDCSTKSQVFPSSDTTGLLIIIRNKYKFNNMLPLILSNILELQAKNFNWISDQRIWKRSAKRFRVVSDWKSRSQRLRIENWDNSSILEILWFKGFNCFRVDIWNMFWFSVTKSLPESWP